MRRAIPGAAPVGFLAALLATSLAGCSQPEDDYYDTSSDTPYEYRTTNPTQPRTTQPTRSTDDDDDEVTGVIDYDPNTQFIHCVDERTGKVVDPRLCPPVEDDYDSRYDEDDDYGYYGIYAGNYHYPIGGYVPKGSTYYNPKSPRSLTSAGIPPKGKVAGGSIRTGSGTGTGTGVTSGGNNAGSSGSGTTIQKGGAGSGSTGKSGSSGS